MTEFHIGDLITITDGHMVSPELMDGVYKILSYMTGDSLMTHQLITASDIMEPVLVEQHPWLKEIEFPDDLIPDEFHVMQWLDELSEKYGKMHEVTPRPDLWIDHDPMSDMLAIFNRGTTVVDE